MTYANANTRTTAEVAPTDVPVPATRTVTYLFNTGTWAGATASETGLKIPYQVAFNGEVRTRARGWPNRIIGRRPFQLQVHAGTAVSLFLNTDSLEGNRLHPVYAVTAGDNDVHVTITETRGTAPTSTATPSFQRSGIDPRTNRQTDFYTAPLHGNIWALVSKVYTEEQARAQMPSTADAGVHEAVASIYRGLTQAGLTVACISPRDHRIAVTFNDSENPRQNVSHYDLLRDGLTRVHPLGFYALLEAGRVAGVTQINITSCWRPSLGSIAHRAGIGLDVNIIADAGTTIRLNRSELVGGGPDLPWVSATEPQLHRRRGDNPQARAAWIAEMEAQKPALFQSFRDSLQTSPHTQQLYDPWYMDNNTGDNTAPVPNDQTAGNPKPHNNHIHLTVNAPGVL